jgi:hypothetical protein
MAACPGPPFAAAVKCPADTAGITVHLHENQWPKGRSQGEINSDTLRPGRRRHHRNDSLTRLVQDHGVKALFISIAVLMSADAAFNHGAVTKATWQIVRHSFSATGGAVSDSVFSH